MTPAPHRPRFTPVADHALLVEFAEALDEAAHGAVLRLDAALTQAPCPGVREWVPAFVNLMVEFDPAVTDHAAVRAHVSGLLDHAPAGARTPATHEVGVCYDAPLSRDLAEVARRTGLSEEAVIAAHLAGDYRVYLYGFAPGYAYMAGVPEALRLDRKTAPVRGVAAGSVIVAGAQCLITTLTMPTGWWILGSTKVRVLTGDTSRPFLFDVGDRVRFRRLTRAEYEASDG
ncbi:MAG: allophanate hydrolase subunit 1 [Rhodobacteraceae bacterium]|nr:allophanate hydrolase subunit 1 [Paracoccaceae bacterium]